MTDVRIVTEGLGGSALSQLLQRGEGPAHWLESASRSAERWRERAIERAGERDWAAMWQSLSPALQADGAAGDRLARVRREGGVVITTGQQPGLFGGPIYTWSKAVSAIALADALQSATGIPTAPIFWAATDDADFAEASSTVVARTGGVEVLRATQAPAPGTPMSLAPLGDLSDPLGRMRDAAGSAADPRAIDAVEAAYGRANRTTGEAFVQLLRKLLEPLGMAVLDASHDAAAAASEATLRLAHARGTSIEQALRRRAGEIRALGYAPQVEEVDGLSLVFVREGEIKRRLPIGEPVRGGRLTPNVLLRPIVERAMLPTVAYVAGPGELAYFAQVSAVAGALGTASPVAVPRWSCTLIEPQIDALMRRHGVSVDDLAMTDVLEGRLARGVMQPENGETLRRLREAIARLPGELREEADRLDLARAVQGAALALEHRVDRLERRLVAGIKQHESALMTDVATLRAALYPRGTRQERLINLVPMLSRQGLALLEEMRDAARPHAAARIESPPVRHSPR